MRFIFKPALQGPPTGALSTDTTACTKVLTEPAPESAGPTAAGGGQPGGHDGARPSNGQPGGRDGARPSNGQLGGHDGAEPSN